MESWRKSKIEHLPPEEAQSVLVNDRLVPHVKVTHGDGGRVHISVGIHGFDCDMFEAESILGLVADAIAVGAGFVAWPDEGLDFVPAPFAPRVTLLGGPLPGDTDHAH